MLESIEFFQLKLVKVSCRHRNRGDVLKSGVVLSGCGAEDGTAIDEAILTFLALERAGAEIICVSLDKDQYEVFNHHTRKSAELDQKRNQLIESARILNRPAKNIETITEDEFDLLVIPGGNGVLKNLSTFVDEEDQFRVNNGLQKLLAGCFIKKKPLGAIGEGVFLIERSLKGIAENLVITASGNTSERVNVVERLAIDHVPCEKGEVCIDRSSRVVTASLLEHGESLLEKNSTIEKLVEKLLEML